MHPADGFLFLQADPARWREICRTNQIKIYGHRLYYAIRFFMKMQQRLLQGTRSQMTTCIITQDDPSTCAASPCSKNGAGYLRSKAVEEGLLAKEPC